MNDSIRQPEAGWMPTDWVEKARTATYRAVPWVLAGIVALLVLYPLLELMRQPFSNLPKVWQQASQLPSLGRILWNTVVLALGSMILAVFVAMILAWCRANMAGKAGAAAQVISILPLVVPPLAGVVGWAFLLSPSVGYLNVLLRKLPFLDGMESGPFDIYSLTWIVVITGIYLIPYAFVFLQAGLANIDPRLEDAARSAGSGWWGVQFRIVLPLLRPALLYGGGVVALLALGQFTAPLLLGRTKGIDVITTQLYRLTGAPPANYPLAAFIALPILLLALAGVAAQRSALRGGLRFVMTGKGAARARGHNALLMLPIIAYSVILVIPPIIGLVIVSLSPFWGAPLTLDSLSLSAFAEVLDSQAAISAVLNSVKYSAIATVLCLVLCLMAALVALRTQGFARALIDYVVNVPIAVPAILFGMAIFVSFALGPMMQFLRVNFGIRLYGSSALIVLAYIILVLPHGTRLVMSGIAQINPQLEAAARVFGSTLPGAVMRILVPLLRRNMASAAMLMFILLSHEFAASSLLFGPNTQVLSTLLYGQWDTGTYPRVAALALVMVAIALLGISLIAVLDGGRNGWRPRARNRAAR
jgi:iron(III) transport system permease protein